MNVVLRNTIKTIDSKLFNGILRKINRKRWQYHSYYYNKPYVKKITKSFKNKITVNFHCNNKGFLGRLFDKYGSARCHCPSNEAQCITTGCYHNIYDLLFRLNRNRIETLLECGIGSKNSNIAYNMSTIQSTPGGGLRSWRDYFPNARIIGMDIDPDTMFTEDRIDTFICDQTSKISINNFIVQAKLKPNTVDIIIDDGMHEFDANITLFENTISLLKDNGIYIIEDFFIQNKEQQKFINYLTNLSDYNVHLFKFTDRYLVIISKNN